MGFAFIVNMGGMGSCKCLVIKSLKIREKKVQHSKTPEYGLNLTFPFRCAIKGD